jgi:lysophospholipase L1-like esterase
MILQARDRIVFLGDSITEQQLYTNQTEAYLSGRFPELELAFFNAGWSGDTAPGGAKRLERDVLALKPSVVTVCYGMNDGGYQAPNADILARFADGMAALVARLKRAGIRVVLLTPGNVDIDSNPNLAACDYGRQGLRVLADHVLELARREGLPVADIHRLMGEAQAKAKAADPRFTFAPDGFHPDPAGHLVMAYGLLEALGVPPCGEAFDLDAAAVLQAGKRGLALDLSLERPPFFVEPAARKILPFLPFQERFNRTVLRVPGLGADDRFLLRSGERRHGPYSGAELAAGIDLAQAWHTAPLKDAALVHRFTLEKNQVYFRLWRGVSLLGAAGPWHDAGALQAARVCCEKLERSRRRLVVRMKRRVRARLAPAGGDGDALKKDGFIAWWSLRGPFPRPYDAAPIGDEAAFSRQPRLDAAWLPADLAPEDHADAMHLVFGLGHEQCFGYALAAIDSPREQRCELLLGSDDGFALWLNGEALASKLDLGRAVVADQDRIPVTLARGRNYLLLKVAQGGGQWGFCARFAGLARPVVNLRP